MVKKKQKGVYDFSFFRVRDYRFRVAGGINYKVRDRRWAMPETPVYAFDTNLELDCEILVDDAWLEDWHISIHSSEDNDQVLDDYHVLDKEGGRKYRKRGNQIIPVYEIPKGIGFLESRGKSGAVWVDRPTVSDMLTAICAIAPIYVFIHEFRENRSRHVVGLDLQNSDPRDE